MSHHFIVCRYSSFPVLYDFSQNKLSVLKLVLALSIKKPVKGSINFLPLFNMLF